MRCAAMPGEFSMLGRVSLRRCRALMRSRRPRRLDVTTGLRRRKLEWIVSVSGYGEVCLGCNRGWLRSLWQPCCASRLLQPPIAVFS